MQLNGTVPESVSIPTRSVSEAVSRGAPRLARSHGTLRYVRGFEARLSSTRLNELPQDSRRIGFVTSAGFAGIHAVWVAPAASASRTNEAATGSVVLFVSVTEPTTGCRGEFLPAPGSVFQVAGVAWPTPTRSVSEELLHTGQTPIIPR